MDQASRRIEIREITGRNGPATVRLAGSIDLQDGASGRFQAAVDDLPLDEQLYQALPEGLQHWWRAFEPKGSIGVRSDLTFREVRGRRDEPSRTARACCWPATRRAGNPSRCR